MPAVTLEDKKLAVAQCRPAIKTIRGVRSRENGQSCRQITTLNIRDFPGAPSLDNGSFKFLLQEADGLPIRVDTSIHQDFVFVVVATDEVELNRKIEESFLLDAFDSIKEKPGKNRPKKRHH